MGRDKALVEVDGRAMAVRVADALAAAGADPVIAQGGDGPALQALGLTWHSDDRPGAGPLAATAQALDASPVTVTVVAACDLPWLRPDDLGLLLEALQHQPDAAAAVPVVQGRTQQSVVAWRTAEAPRLRGLVAAGAAALHQALGEVTVLRLDLPESPAWHDVDAPGDLRAAPGRPHDGRYAAPAPEPPNREDAVPEPVPEIDVDGLARARESGARLVDVRQPAEWDEVRVPGAELVPLDEVPDRVDEMAGDGPLYVICRSGGRSARACEVLRASGIDAVNVAGGTLAWIDAGQPTEHGPA